MTKQIHNNACIRLNLKNNLKTCILRVSITFLKGGGANEKKKNLERNLFILLSVVYNS